MILKNNFGCKESPPLLRTLPPLMQQKNLCSKKQERPKMEDFENITFVSTDFHNTRFVFDEMFSYTFFKKLVFCG